MGLDYNDMFFNADHIICACDKETGVIEEITPMFDVGFDCPEAYKNAGIRGYSPMLANELDQEDPKLKEFLSSSNYIIEEKFDGVRGILHFFSQPTIEGDNVGYTRLFSRNICKETGFYTENSDKVPHIRDIDVPDMDGTVLDGELFINGQPFKEVSSTLNCLWDKAIERQMEKGLVVFHAFDIIRYKGIDMKRLPLKQRKKYLKYAIEEIDSSYVEEVKYYVCGDVLKKVNPYTELYNRIKPELEEAYFDMLEEKKDIYPEIYSNFHSRPEVLTPLGFYELIVSTGGEGIIIKPIDGKYTQKRGWEYTKLKAFITRELILMDFEEPTKEYKGKRPKDWAFYEDGVAVTKHYYNKQVGNLVLGVCVDYEEIRNLPKKKKFNITEMPIYRIPKTRQDYKVMEVCVCSGFDDETRAYFTRNKDKLIGSVIEVKANGVFKDTGFLRHPRFLRMRPDKSPEECLFKDHIQ